MPTPFDAWLAAHETWRLNPPKFVAPAPIAHVPVADDVPVCLIFSPHPDDEVIVGGAPLRLRQEGWRVVNVVMTLGSKQSRRAERWKELENCCNYLGFELISSTGENQVGIENLRCESAQNNPHYWQQCRSKIVEILTRYQPRVIVCPHDLDGHGAHIGTHYLVLDALAQMPKNFSTHCLLSEYWNTQLNPRLMLELSNDDVAQMMTGLAMHTGEVARNPYHLGLPAWLMDSARRGAERVAAPGSAATGALFAALYGGFVWRNQHAEPMPPTMVRVGEALAEVFELAVI